MRGAPMRIEPHVKKPDGLENLKAILRDQPYQNSALSVHEIETVLENKGGFMPDEAVLWFRQWRTERTT